jgi:hypothetical protein
MALNQSTAKVIEYIALNFVFGPKFGITLEKEGRASFKK